jgi:hypothetical protein
VADQIVDTRYRRLCSFSYNTFCFLPAFLVVTGIAEAKQLTSSGHLNGYEERPKALKESALCDLQRLALGAAAPYRQQAYTDHNDCN